MQEDGSSMGGQEELATDVMDSMGMSQDTGSSQEEGEHGEGESQLPQFAKERIGKLQKRHTKEMRGLSSKVQDLEAQLQSMMSNRSSASDYPEQSDMGFQSNPSSEDDRIQRAVHMALSHQKMQEQKAREAQSAAHVHKQYQNLQDSLDEASSKYEDFDDVVRSDNAPFTPTMRDAALLLPKHLQADVLYKLGKNPEELQRIKDLHPIDQTKEMVRLSIALSAGNGKSDAPNTTSVKTIGQVKNTPVTNRNVSEATPVSEIRRRMRDRNGWK